MKKRVLFLCYGNACRSIMAEALTRYHWGEVIAPASAGVNALGHIPEETIEVLQERGVDTAGLYSKGIRQMGIDEFQLIIDLAAYPFEEILPPSFKGKLLHWEVRDPYFEGLEGFRRTRETIEWLVTEKLPKYIDGKWAFPGKV